MTAEEREAKRRYYEQRARRSARNRRYYLAHRAEVIERVKRNRARA